MIRRIAEDITLAITFMTRLPLPCAWVQQNRKLSDTLWALPLAGACVGAFGGGIAILAGQFELGAQLAAILALAAMVLITGALHEDGLADFFDGVGGGATAERRLTIMRDSRIGTYGVIVLILVFAALMVTIAELFASLEPSRFFLAMISAAALARCSVAAIFVLLPPARDDGLAAFFGLPGRLNRAVTLIWPAIAVIFLFEPLAAAALLAGACIATLTTAAMAFRYLGGYTGDVFGAGKKCSRGKRLK